LGSPPPDWRWWFDWGCHRRAAATGRWWRGRGHSNSGEDGGGAGQRVARAASLGPSGCAEIVGWLGDRVEGGARRQQQRGGAAGGIPASWRLGLSNTRKGRLQGVLGHAGATRVGRASGRSGELAVHLQWRGAVAPSGREREREDRPDFIAQHEAVECFIAHQGEGRGSTSMVWPGYGGMGGDARRLSDQWREAVPPSSA
jgi:hypothetical protein